MVHAVRPCRRGAGLVKEPVILQDRYAGDTMPNPTNRRITRFTVMATLQAARARRLGLSEASAYSWGLNRAIFYAAARRGFDGATTTAPTGEPRRATAPPADLYSLGNDEAYRDPNAAELLFTIGGETQTPEAFRRQVAARFGQDRNFDSAWQEAMGIVGEFEEETLRSGREFYARVYKPRRDDLVAKWSEAFLGPGEVEAPPRAAKTGLGRR